MIKSTLLGLAGAVLLGGMAVAAEPESCKTVRFSDVGWTDITATTGLTSAVLEGLGYQTSAEILSVPVTYQSLKNGDIDVFQDGFVTATGLATYAFEDPAIPAGFAPFMSAAATNVAPREFVAGFATPVVAVISTSPCVPHVPNCCCTDW